MGMTVEQVMDAILERLPHQVWQMAVRVRNCFALDVHPSDGVIDLNVHDLGIAPEVCDVIAIAEHDAGIAADQFIQHSMAANVAEVNEKLAAALLKEGDRAAGYLRTTVRIREDSKSHEGSLNPNEGLITFGRDDDIPAR